MLGPSLARRLKYSMLELNIAASANNLGPPIGEPIAGICTSYFGVSRTIRGGLLLMAVSLIGLSQMYSGTIPISSYWLAAAFFFHMNAGSIAASTAVSTTVCSNTTDEARGRAMSLLTLANSFSSSMYVIIRGIMGFIGGEPVNTSAILLVLAAIMVIVPGIVSFGILNLPTHSDELVAGSDEPVGSDMQLTGDAKEQASARKNSERKDANSATPLYEQEFIDSAVLEPPKNPECVALLSDYDRRESDTGKAETQALDASHNSTSSSGPGSERLCEEASSALSDETQDESIMALLRTKPFWYILVMRFVLDCALLVYVSNVEVIARVLLLEEDPNASESKIQYVANMHATALSMAGIVGALLAGVTNDFLESRGRSGPKWLVMGSILVQTVNQLCVYAISSPYVLLAVSVGVMLAGQAYNIVMYIIFYKFWPGKNFGRNM
ncbi:major facilitator superfamily domain-containing protein [Thamnocephalis sphaerospora]|uniref:Major facilitator superfamily domain-containing protein n=1 Tax=Thamnocephalis sphaerospora TaxID=78915 RepID=A0A4P9XG14_9FUNG|nr:major facilitator superfamily domain-containing protein [Thamnocephalis sphaerospora]|eukprot:RKP04532.1 major facilitator superfamily domain-containing protein [Thamnocephalis sphaerospora]